MIQLLQLELYHLKLHRITAHIFVENFTSPLPILMQNDGRYYVENRIVLEAYKPVFYPYYSRKTIEKATAQIQYPAR